MRHSAIAKEHARTCAWVLRDSSTTKPWSLFSKWLRDDAGIYWVNGKAGSGKSTLMKLIWNHPRTTQLLAEWADNACLVRAAFFFWNSGEKIQSTQEGLFRSLLYQLCRRYPEFLHKAFPDEWETLSDKASCDLEIDKAAPKSLAELKDAFEKVAACASQELRMCIFIDGFDETEGDIMDITDFIVQVANSSPYIKVCVSSRPWPVFETSFHRQPSLKMQDLNGDDIRRFTLDKLGRDPNVRNLLGPEPGKAEWLIEEVVSRACGVFLWVCLVVNLLIKGIRDGDDTMALYNRLLSLPGDLEALFQRILGQIEPAYQAEASQIFQVFRANGNKLDILTMHRALMYTAPQTPDQALRLKVTPSTAFQKPQHRAMLEALIARGIRRLHSRCRGLLEVNDGDEQDPVDMSMEELEQPDYFPTNHMHFQSYRRPGRASSRYQDTNSNAMPDEISRPREHMPHESSGRLRTKTDEAEHDAFYRTPSTKGRRPGWLSESVEVRNRRRRRALGKCRQSPATHSSSAIQASPAIQVPPPIQASPATLASSQLTPGQALTPRDTLQVQIRYLHRTARDYLEQPHIWSQILSMSASFDPQAALLAASVNAVKMSHEVVQPSTIPALTPSSFAAYLRDLILKPCRAHLNLIDDLDRAFAARRMEDDLQRLDLGAMNQFVKTWENVGPSREFKSIVGTDWQGDELAATTRNIPPWYASLEDADQNDGSVVCLTDNQGLPPAFSAIAKRIGIPSFFAMALSWLDWTKWLSIPSATSNSTAGAPWPGAISLVRSVMLTSGFGPDSYRLHGHTLWEYIITVVHNLSNMYHDDPCLALEMWLRVFEIMLENDADPCAACIHNSQEFVDAISISGNWEAPEAVINHMVMPREGLASAGYDEEQWSPSSRCRYYHSVEAVVRDVFVRRKVPGAERLLSLVHKKKRMWEDLNVKRQDDADNDGGGINYPHWVS